ncbi:hypothetical protein GCM10010910_06300 [Microbacterium nanhaiense]|uniref:Antitoxin VbhA domain-containing protein n=1 Tax=Microbacterium nanhaiense TaxID=1301026 RepID=A0ABQ2MZT3_9MICO|nr:hypothetical protein [Microbacterium nanhaiense]GGO60564.1 hypothetical protein GCM10010910_06300 [Microbacterium nanhaiense]
MAEIHEWWPKLSAESKNALEERPGEVLPLEIRDEIRHITGEFVPAQTMLSDEDIEFIKTQREAVD